MFKIDAISHTVLTIALAIIIMPFCLGGEGGDTKPASLKCEVSPVAATLKNQTPMPLSLIVTNSSASEMYVSLPAANDLTFKVKRLSKDGEKEVMGKAITAPPPPPPSHYMVIDGKKRLLQMVFIVPPKDSVQIVNNDALKRFHGKLEDGERYALELQLPYVETFEKSQVIIRNDQEHKFWVLADAKARSSVKNDAAALRCEIRIEKEKDK